LFVWKKIPAWDAGFPRSVAFGSQIKSVERLHLLYAPVQYLNVLSTYRLVRNGLPTRNATLIFLNMQLLTGKPAS